MQQLPGHADHCLNLRDGSFCDCEQVRRDDQSDPDHRPEFCDCGQRHTARSVYSTYTNTWECVQCWADFIDCPEM